MISSRHLYSAGLGLSLSFGLNLASFAQTNFVDQQQAYNFNRIATFAVCRQLDENCNTDTETSAEIVTASNDGNTLIYSNSPYQSLGFVDITKPQQAQALGELKLAGEPTSVTVLNDWALAAVNSSQDYVNVSGQLVIVDIKTQTIVHQFELGGQPDSIAVSPDGNYLGVVIENERDEDHQATEGKPYQMPAGEFIVFNTQDPDPSLWQMKRVALTGLADWYSDDPEPEFVDINSQNIAVVTLQENNHIVLIDLKSASVINHFSAGSVDLEHVDVEEEKPALVALSGNLKGLAREPDGVTWIDDQHFVTADEGDLAGGSRGFTIFNRDGVVVYGSGNSLDHLAVQLGHYPDSRSKNKGNEPENAEFAQFGDTPLLFVNSERSSLIFIYDLSDINQPQLRQILPTAAAPEGVYAIPERQLLIAASEKDDRGDKLRSALNIYQYAKQSPDYPSLVSVIEQQRPIAWSAMSGLSADLKDPKLLYAVNDSYYQQNQVFTIDTSHYPAQVVAALSIKDTNDVLATTPVVTVDAQLSPEHPERRNVFDSADLSAMTNADKTVNIDPEGISVSQDGGFWVASEGAGTVGDDKRPVMSSNLILKLDDNAVIEKVIQLEPQLNLNQQRFGLEGISEYQGKLYFAIQRPWSMQNFTQIGVYDLASATTTMLNYPLDNVSSPNGGWVGISEITAIGEQQFLVLERDNQSGPDAAVKRIYKVDLSQLSEGRNLTKTLHLDLLKDTRNSALSFEKYEGMARTIDGALYVINDNDGLKDNSGETQLLRLK
ncbi:esterase-like activity of phytase family protein [Alginatibacterium sediminis]|uniref:Esterase-like activity of phytase family protein n=1 Tax=Alginatibacterium sediminis TaxID=2164068 RepID=A0A420ELE2_9ALTE|nr:esterase-like activity of phytase family protein [Alginatibacterium sediminis]RKF21515.1 esterase-like activity of phytase family protein [Alginatibacterium sediminis]